MMFRLHMLVNQKGFKPDLHLVFNLLSLQFHCECCTVGDQHSRFSQFSVFPSTGTGQCQKLLWISMLLLLHTYYRRASVVGSLGCHLYLEQWRNRNSMPRQTLHLFGGNECQIHLLWRKHCCVYRLTIKSHFADQLRIWVLFWIFS